MKFDPILTVLLILTSLSIITLNLKLIRARVHINYLKQRICENVLEKRTPTTLLEDLQTVLLLHDHGRIKDLKTYNWSYGTEEIHVSFDRKVK